MGTTNLHYNDCPKCGGDNINWQGFEIIDNSGGYYSATCEDCGFEGRQWMQLTFDMWQEGPDKDGQYNDIQ